MRRTPNPSSSDAPDDLPPALLRDLADLYAGPAVPREIDAQVRNDAVAHFARTARKSRPGRLLRWVGGGAAAAAAVVLAAMLLPRSGSGPQPLAVMREAHRAAAPAASPMAPPVASAQDIDRNGRVDILDAFTIARALQAQNGPPDAWDVTGDGKVDQADIDRVAGSAVRVTKVASAEGQGRRRASSDVATSHADVAGGGTIR